MSKIANSESAFENWRRLNEVRLRLLLPCLYGVLRSPVLVLAMVSGLWRGFFEGVG